jgi:hypothetical protein
MRVLCTLIIVNEAPHFGSVNLPPTSSAKLLRPMAVVNLFPHSEQVMLAITCPPNSGEMLLVEEDEEEEEDPDIAAAEVPGVFVVADFVCFCFLLLNDDARRPRAWIIYLVRLPATLLWCEAGAATAQGQAEVGNQSVVCRPLPNPLTLSRSASTPRLLLASYLVALDYCLY